MSNLNSISKSGVWEYFEKDSAGTGQVAKCNICKSNLKAVGGSTKGLHTHLATKHDINLLKRKDSDVSHGSSSSAIHPQTTAKSTKLPGMLSQYVVSDIERSLGATMSRMCSCDGVPFRFFVHSPDMRKALVALGFTNIPKSAASIQQLVMEHGRKVRSLQLSEINQRMKKGERFSLTFDEWTSTRNRRYMIVNLHGRNTFWSLG